MINIGFLSELLFSRYVYIFYVNVIALFNAVTDVFGLYILAPTYMCVLGVSFLRKTLHIDSKEKIHITVAIR